MPSFYFVYIAQNYIFLECTIIHHFFDVGLKVNVSCFSLVYI